MTVIMNPPYLRGLYIKILNKAKSIANETICLAPNIFENYKKNTDISQPYLIKNIDKETSRHFFKIQLSTNLSIYKYNNKLPLKDWKAYYTPEIYYIFNKLKFNTSLEEVNKENYSGKGIFVPLKLMTSPWDNNKNRLVAKVGIIKDNIALSTGHYFRDDLKRNKNRNIGGVYFSTLEEAKNFANSLETKFMQTWVKALHTNSRYILSEYPFMEDYTQPWTNERFYKYFDLSKDEIKIIESFETVPTK